MSLTLILTAVFATHYARPKGHFWRINVASWEKNKVSLIRMENHLVNSKKFTHLPEFRIYELGKNINVVVGEEQGSVIGKNQKAELKKRM